MTMIAYETGTPFAWQYYFVITYLDYQTGNTVKTSGIVPADSYTDAMSFLAEEFGDECIIKVMMDAETDLSDMKILKRDGAMIITSIEQIDGQEGENDIEC